MQQGAEKALTSCNLIRDVTYTRVVLDFDRSRKPMLQGNQTYGIAI